MTRRLSRLFACALAGLLATHGSTRADTTNAAPDFKEVYELLRANLPGATDGTLNRAAVEGLLSQFPGRVSLVGGSADGSAVPAGGSALGQSRVIENNVAYFRVNRVTGRLAGELGAAARALTATNKVAGVILDLRFAGGDDFAAAQETAGLWTVKKTSRPVAGPLVVLVNGGTSGTAEALATALHTAGAALILGSPTAGPGTTFKAFVLKDGERLLIAAAATPDNKTVAAGGLKPDLTVAVSADDELGFWKNPFGTPASDRNRPRSATNTFLPFVDHTSEADLVREKMRDGNSPLPYSESTRPVMPDRSDDSGEDEGFRASAGTEPPRPVLRDPVLARAVDLVKGLAAVREARP